MTSHPPAPVLRPDSLWAALQGAPLPAATVIPTSGGSCLRERSCYFFTCGLKAPHLVLMACIQPAHLASAWATGLRSGHGLRGARCQEGMQQAWGLQQCHEELGARPRCAVGIVPCVRNAPSASCWAVHLSERNTSRMPSHAVVWDTHLFVSQQASRDNNEETVGTHY